MVNFQEAPRELFSDCLSIEMARFFKDLDEQYTHDLSLPVHHNHHTHTPLVRVSVFNATIKLAEELAHAAAVLMAPTSCRYCRCQYSNIEACEIQPWKLCLTHV